MTLFDHHRQQLSETEAPLAARMRPRSLAEFIGQDHILGVGRLLRRAIEADQLSSLLFYGPPGTGKTTLARVIANRTAADFIALNAVLAGIKDIRAAIAQAQERRGQFSQRTLLFIDEVHRFNKAQQDALLPWVENGTVILIGATTENPYFEVNKALVSRSRIFQLQPLTAENLRQIVAQTLQDPDRGYGQRPVQIDPEALDHLVNIANGDARTLLNALELAVDTTPPAAGTIHITLSVAEDSIQQRAVLYDKEGDAHFDTISAFIKSLRGSDPDAALYWLARMVYSGEDPRFLFRRMLILAGEDVGMADPQAIAVVNACAAAFDRVGLPEGQYPLAQAALYLATAPKSNSVMGFFDALRLIEQTQADDVPNHLRDATRDRDSLGHGQGYRYPHAYADHWVAQQYMPGNLQGQVFYQPSDQGYEQQIQRQVTRRREAQIAALTTDPTLHSLEALTFSPAAATGDRWLQRTISQQGQRLEHIRDRVFDLARLQRHDRVLDLSAATGLFTWEALRHVPEGAVYAVTPDDTTAQALAEQAQALPPIQRPIVLTSTLPDLALSLDQHSPGIQFEAVIGRNLWSDPANRPAIAPLLRRYLAPGGQWIVAETIPRRSQRLYDWLSAASVPADLYAKLVHAEEHMYVNPDSPLAWDVDELAALGTELGGSVAIAWLSLATDVRITAALLHRWFDDQLPTSYASRLSPLLSKLELTAIQQAFQRTCLQQTRSWHSELAIVSSTPAPPSAQPPSSL